MSTSIEAVALHKCTGCGACMNICPKQAIVMKADDEGFLFPAINHDICVQCGLCLQKCPANNPEYENNDQPDCYAAWADQETRLNSSSGGIFSRLAEYYWAMGGAVAGAIFDEDYRGVHHIVTPDRNDLAKLRTSKYLQSDTRYVYREIAELLRKSVPVLFVGTPCQVAALKKIAGNHKNLLTVDIACKSVPSTKAYNMYLDEISKGRNIKSVAFRDKSLWGWSASFRVCFEDNTQYFCAEWNNEPFYKGFLGLLIDRKSCGECPFAHIPRQGDITLADFWGIHKKDQSWDDRYGTSLVLVNSEKGKNVFKTISDNLSRVAKMDTAFAAANNPALVRPLPTHPGRNRFFKLMPEKGYTEALTDVLQQRYDAGIMGFWIGTNYGTILTNYGLNHVLQDQGLSVCMIDTCSGRPRDEDYPYYSNHRKEFEKKHYNILRDPNLTNLNEHVDTFVIGSDQVWKYELTRNFGHVMFLDFVSDENRKISYAASFGDGSFNNNGEYRRVASYNLKRFDAVSVREAQGVDVCKEQFSVEATHVMDPVFLCQREKYDDLILDSRRNVDGDYLFAYILDPTPQKRDILKQVSSEMGLKPVIVLDCEPWRYDQNKVKMDMDDCVLDGVFVEDFLKLLSQAKAVVTDSFHGTAFSIIYDKPFFAIANPGRGFARFESLLNMLKLTDRLVYPYQPFDVKYRANQLRASMPGVTKDIIRKEVDRSKRWLNNALFAERTAEKSMLNDKIYAQGCMTLHLQREHNFVKQELETTRQELATTQNELNFTRQELLESKAVCSQEIEALKQSIYILQEQRLINRIKKLVKRLLRRC